MKAGLMDEIWKRDEIESPCVKMCVIHPKADICVGCFRTLNEIEEWSELTPDRRASIRAKLAERGKSLVKRRGGRTHRSVCR